MIKNINLKYFKICAKLNFNSFYITFKCDIFNTGHLNSPESTIYQSQTKGDLIKYAID